MTEPFPRSVVVAIAVVGLLLLVCFAYLRPVYFTSVNYLGGLLFFEVLLAAVWFYPRIFFPLLVMSFLLAGVNVPGSSIWTVARWVVLGVGALVGSAIMLRDRRYHFGFFHVIAVFAVLAALMSAAVSHFTSVSLLKVLSLLCLFVYASTGARIAVAGRENRFFSGLITGCEIFVAAVAVAYLAGAEVMGNPNSLGAVMGVAGAPILLWGTLVTDEKFVRLRRWAMYAVCVGLVVISHARAGMIAAFGSCALLCLVLRRYRLLMQGILILTVLIAGMAVLEPDAFSRSVSAFTDSFVFKGKDPSRGVFESRTSPWSDAVKAIQQNFWFGTGFGTADNGIDATDNLGKFATTDATTNERANSYLSILTWVGVMGVLPFSLLVGILMKKIVQTVRWILRTGNPFHPAVPLAMVMFAGLVHAAFEDWMFAPGYYLCVFFWSLAFVFADVAPSSHIAAPGSERHGNVAWPAVGPVALRR